MKNLLASLYLSHHQNARTPVLVLTAFLTAAVLGLGGFF